MATERSGWKGPVLIQGGAVLGAGFVVAILTLTGLLRLPSQQPPASNAPELSLKKTNAELSVEFEFSVFQKFGAVRLVGPAAALVTPAVRPLEPRAMRQEPAAIVAAPRAFMSEPATAVKLSASADVAARIMGIVRRLSVVGQTLRMPGTMMAIPRLDATRGR